MVSKRIQLFQLYKSIIRITIFPITFWSILIFLYDLPGYLMHYKPNEISGILAYVLAFSLFESTLLAFGIMILAMLLPKKWFMDHFISQSFVIVFVSSFWFAAAHFLNWRSINDSGISFLTSQIGSIPGQLIGIFWLISYLLTIGLLIILMRRSQEIERLINNIADQLFVISTIFLAFGILGVVIVVVRNIL